MWVGLNSAMEISATCSSLCGWRILGLSIQLYSAVFSSRMRNPSRGHQHANVELIKSYAPKSLILDNLTIWEQYQSTTCLTLGRVWRCSGTAIFANAIINNNATFIYFLSILFVINQTPCHPIKQEKKKVWKTENVSLYFLYILSQYMVYFITSINFSVRTRDL